MQTGENLALARREVRARRVAIVHYWLVGMRGGERVLERLLHLFPSADIFTHVYKPDAVSPLIRSRRVTTSFIQRLPAATSLYQKYLPLMPLALEQLDLRGYDLVISSELGPAKGVITPLNALHICYCHSPMRLWDHYHDYSSAAGRLTRTMMPWLAHRLRQWDTTSASRVDRIAANSSFVQRRIARAWGRQSKIVYPPVDMSLFKRAESVTDRYLWVGQLDLVHKRPDIAVDAFNRLGLPLLMVGAGDMANELRRKAGPNITIVERLDFAVLRKAYAGCRALVFTAEEDFGLVPVEAMASGRPVLAYGSGGARDSVVPEETGLFFDEQSVDALCAAVERLEDWLPYFDPSAERQAGRFGFEQFDAGIMELASQ